MKHTTGGELPPEPYRQAMENVPLVTVDVLFFNPEKTKTLLGRRTNEPYAGMWYSFGGRLYKNEEFVDAAIRLAKKETGVSLSPDNLVQAGVLNEINPNSIFDGINYHSVNIYFACIIDHTDVSLDHQHSEARWIDIDDQSLYPYVRAKIAGALHALSAKS